MPITNNNIAGIHRKEWQMMTPIPAANAASSQIVIDPAHESNISLYISSATVMYLYHADEDSYVQIASGSITQSAAGMTGVYHRWSNTVTANGGTTSGITTTAAVCGIGIGKKVRFLTGLNIGLEALITNIIVVPGGTNVIYLDTTLPNVVSNGDTFIVNSGRFFVQGGSTSYNFRHYDLLTSTWSSNLTVPLGNILTDAFLVSQNSSFIYSTGTTTSATGTTLADTSKVWTVNQFSNYSVRIVSGTGIGQVRSITSNTINTLTVATWTINPDATSVYEVTGNDDYIYLLGNAAVTLYRYVVSTNTWSTITPGVARGGVLTTGGGANIIHDTGNTVWGSEGNIMDGRYIYSFRGGGVATLDRYDIALNAWLNDITYGTKQETFTTGTHYVACGRYIYIRKEATHRYFKFSVTGNYLEPLAVNLYPDSTATVGCKIAVLEIEGLRFLYSIRQTATEVFRILLI